MRDSLEELDGVFTYIAVTEDALGVCKDEMAAKPLVLYESDGLVALASRRSRSVPSSITRSTRTTRTRGRWLVGSGRRAGITYDARGLAEPFAEAPRTAEIEHRRATFDAHDLSTRQINLELRRLLYGEGIEDVTVLNPGSKHSLGVGILTRCRITSAAASATSVRTDRRAGDPRHRPGRLVGLREHDVGVVIVDGNAGSLTAAAIRGGDVVVKGSGRRAPASTRRAAPSSFRGRRLHDWLHDAARPADPPRRRRAGPATPCTTGRSTSAARSPRSASTASREWTDADTELIERKFRIYGLGDPPELQKFVCGKKLYNYDNLEPSERKLVL